MQTSSVHVLGGWQSDFAKRWEEEDPLLHMLATAAEASLDDAGLQPEDVEVIHVGNLAGELFCGQAHLGGLAASAHPAFVGRPTARHEGACASGSLAVLAAMAELEAGRYDVALVLGAEVERNVSGVEAGQILGCAGWVGHEEQDPQFPWPSQFARIADVYDETWGLDYRHLARIAQINYANARRNPNAQTRKWGVEDADFCEDDDRNPVVSGRLRKLDCGRITDGCAGVVLVSDRWLERRGGRVGGSPAAIRGWGHATGPLSLVEKLHPRERPGREVGPYLFPHVHSAVVDAMTRAGVAHPTDLDAVEVHDCFTISEYVALDHLGIAPPGQAWQLIDDRVIGHDGALPVNASGGLIGLGHPVGATGVRMLLDATRQVTGTAGDYQVPGARTAATLNIGGSFTTAVSFVVGAASA